MISARFALGLGFVLVASAGSPADRDETPLAGLVSVGSLVVTAANDTVPEAEVRLAVERRLQQAGIAVDGESQTELVVDVTADRNRSDVGNCAFAIFTVVLALREPVRAERAPGGVFTAITWQTSGSTRWFSTKVPPRSIMDGVENRVSAFLRAVASDTHKANVDAR